MVVTMSKTANRFACGAFINRIARRKDCGVIINVKLTKISFMVWNLSFETEVES